MLYPGIWTIVSVMFMAVAARFFYTVGEHERSGGRKWALVSFGVWIVIFFILKQGLLWQILGQLGLFATLTVLNMLGSRNARIIK